MLESRLQELARLARAGKLTDQELARARAAVIANYLASYPAAGKPAPAPAVPGQAPPAPVPPKPKGVGPLPRRMVPVALALGSAVVVDGAVARAVPDGSAGASSGEF